MKYHIKVVELQLLYFFHYHEQCILKLKFEISATSF